jgi:hypothetical protein
MDAAEWPSPNKSLKYDKGENRHKHSGKHQDARIIYENGLWIGKCPQGFLLAEAQTLLENGLPEFRNTTAEKPFRLWSYYQGAIYRARSSDGGATWHGFPAKDEPPRDILKKLEHLAQQQGEEKLLKQWLKKQWDHKS